MHKVASKALFDKQVRFPAALLAERRWEVLSSDFPLLDVVFNDDGRVPLRVHLGCIDWHELPPAIGLLDRDGNYLSSVPRDPAGVFNSSAHPTVGRPFICMRGSLEYHIHPSHTNDLWEQFRGKSGYDLGGILTQVWRAWKKAKP